MSVQITRNINIVGCGMPMMPMMPMGGCCPGIMRASVFCRPYPMIAMTGAMAAGVCTGVLLANPQVLNGIGKCFNGIYNHVIQPVWNGVIKPAANWVYGSLLKPAWNNFIKPAFGYMCQGLKWVWDHTLGWVIKKIGSRSSKKAAEAATEE